MSLLVIFHGFGEEFFDFSDSGFVGGVGAEVGMRITEATFDFLDAPVKRVAARDVPIPFSPVLEDFVVPSEQRIEDEIKEML